jgi:aspartyl-tRNA synthetase
LRPADARRQVTLNGWAHRVRDLGGLFFVDLRDRSGMVQVLFDPQSLTGLQDIRSETCLSVTGAVRMRSEETRNPKMATGDVEVEAASFEILGPAKALPFPLSDEDQMATVNEELRIRYRYLDLRRPAMARRLQLRAAAVRKIRRFLDERGFLEVETPIITRSTPEGARDYLVPYRLNPGLFYALPQSPQQYKQLLMVAGIERYYQIAKCFRDESQRSDRQPEFTQLDLEMSFIVQEDILQIAEELTLAVLNELIAEFDLPKDPVKPFERIAYDDAMRLYGCDKPDLRFGLQLFEVGDALRGTSFGVFKSVLESGGRIRGVRYPGGASLSRKEVGILEEFCKTLGAKGLATMSVDASTAEPVYTSAAGLGVRGGISKQLSPAEIEAVLAEAKAESGDLLCFIADEYAAGNSVLYRLRNEIGDRCGLRDRRQLKLCWVLDFPLVERDAETGGWTPTHHPFTAPKPSDMGLLDTDPGKVHADCYDIVCNGTEWASGSIRIHQADIQARVFSLLGIDEKTQQERFGHMLEAFQYGAPPHGGIAPGIDRLIMFLTDDENIREVIAFPKVGQGYDPMMDAPSPVDAQQWKELGLRLTDG